MRILLIEDHPIVRAACRRLLESRDGLQTWEAHNGADGLKLCQENFPDIIILDLQLPDFKGLDMLRRLLTEFPQAKVLIFTMYEDAAIASEAMKAGAMGYITKGDNPDTLIEALDSLSKGVSYLGPAIAQKFALSNLSSGENKVGRLTPRELEIFSLIGEGLSLDAIAVHLGISYKTVANRSGLIKEKLGLQTTVALVKTAVEWRQRKGLFSDSVARPGLA